MAFTANAINYAESYQRALVQEYPHVLHFAALYTTPNNQKIQWVDAKTIRVPSLSVAGRHDNDRDSITEMKRNYNNDWETYTLERERVWDTLVHPMDIVQTNMVATIQNITERLNDEVKFVEKDDYLVSKIFSEVASAGGDIDTTALTTENVLTVFNKMYQARREARVPIANEVLYITPAVDTLIKEARQRYLNATEGILRQAINQIDDVKIEVVPSEQMYTLYDFDPTYTSAPIPDKTVTSTSAQVRSGQINMFYANPSAVITPEVYSFVGLADPSAITQGKYYYYEEEHADVFIIKKRLGALNFNVTYAG